MTSKKEERIIFFFPVGSRLRIHTHLYKMCRSLPGCSYGKESIGNAGDLALSPGLGRSPGRGHGNPLQYSCLENLMGKGAWRAPVHRVTKSQT